jgi:hypothetical protein
MRYLNTPRWTDPVLQRRSRQIAVCASKERHQSEGAAKAHYRSLERRFGRQMDSLVVYWCPTCRGWHLGREQRNVGSAGAA